MLREDLGPSIEAHSRRWELVVNAYPASISQWVGNRYRISIPQPFIRSDPFIGFGSSAIYRLSEARATAHCMSLDPDCFGRPARPRSHPGGPAAAGRSGPGRPDLNRDRATASWLAALTAVGHGGPDWPVRMQSDPGDADPPSTGRVTRMRHPPSTEEARIEAQPQQPPPAGDPAPGAESGLEGSSSAIREFNREQP